MHEVGISAYTINCFSSIFQSLCGWKIFDRWNKKILPRNENWFSFFCNEGKQKQKWNCFELKIAEKEIFQTRKLTCHSDPTFLLTWFQSHDARGWVRLRYGNFSGTTRVYEKNLFAYKEWWDGIKYIEMNCLCTSSQRQPRWLRHSIEIVNWRVKALHENMNGQFSSSFTWWTCCPREGKID